MKPCLVCGTLTASGSRCPAHRRPSTRRTDPRARAKAYQRDGGQCVRCGRAGTEVHHRIPAALGGPDTPGNLITLCHKCHKAEHVRPGQMRRV